MWWEDTGTTKSPQAQERVPSVQTDLGTLGLHRQSFNRTLFLTALPSVSVHLLPTPAPLWKSFKLHVAFIMPLSKWFQ